ncbi:MAG: MBL fold metallo-hydrolase RNA specificity domain-containing protein [Planctomycetota bacterium]
MRITFYGAARNTTGSMHLLQVNDHKILFDCGLCQGHRKEAFERNRNLPFAPDELNACVLSHAHIDHSGNLPSLVTNGYSGPIYATPATQDLCDIMLMDSAYLQVKDVEYVNKKRRKKGKTPFEPLYTQEDASNALSCFVPVPYENPVEIADGVAINFHDAGHILGAALTEVTITENDQTTRLMYTGDLGRPRQPILRDPVIVRNIDFLITESTYGNRLHPADENVKQTLEDVCQRTLDHSSRLVVPAFSVGRTQQLLYFLHELWNEERLCDIPIYVDSPLSTKATRVYEDHPECYDMDMMANIMEDDNPFTMHNITYTENVDESKKLNDMDGPVIIISASGMCEGGRILHHLKNTVEDENNTVLIVGYQAENTLGRRIVNEEDTVKIYGDKYPLNAKVVSIQALSAHADRDEMLTYFKEMGPEFERTFVVHGEPEQQKPFAQSLRELGADNVHIPELGNTFEL